MYILFYLPVVAEVAKNELRLNWCYNIYIIIFKYQKFHLVLIKVHNARLFRNCIKEIIWVQEKKIFLF